MKNTNNQSEKRNRYGYTKEEIKENRKKALENPLEEIIKPTLKYWKEKPIKSIGMFLMWVGIVYLVMTVLQAINYDMMYCDSTLDEYDGKIMRVHEGFVQEMNQKIADFRTQNQPTLFNTDPKDLVLPQSLNQTIRCTYDIKRWWYDESDFSYNMKKMVIQRWTRNKNTN